MNGQANPPYIVVSNHYAGNISIQYTVGIGRERREVRSINFSSSPICSFLTLCDFLLLLHLCTVPLFKFDFNWTKYMKKLRHLMHKKTQFTLHSLVFHISTVSIPIKAQRIFKRIFPKTHFLPMFPYHS